MQYSELTKRQLKQHPAINQLCLLFASIGSCSSLQQELLNNIIEQTFVPQQLFYHKQEYLQRCEQAEEKLMDNLTETITVVKNLLSAHQQLKKQLKVNVPFALINTHRHIQEQLKLMFYPGFISRTPIQWLRRFPRYIKAIEYRLEKATRDPRRDDILQKEIDFLWQPFIAKLQIHEKNQSALLHNSNWIEYRWLLEELRLSLFAQELKAVQPVSVKRLDKIWQKEFK